MTRAPPTDAALQAAASEFAGDDLFRAVVNARRLMLDLLPLAAKTMDLETIAQFGADTRDAIGIVWKSKKDGLL